MIIFFFQVEVKRALPKEVQQQQAALRAAVAGRGMIPTIGESMPGQYSQHFTSFSKSVNIESTCLADSHFDRMQTGRRKLCGIF